MDWRGQPGWADINLQGKRLKPAVAKSSACKKTASGGGNMTRGSKASLAEAMKSYSRGPLPFLREGCKRRVTEQTLLRTCPSEDNNLEPAPGALAKGPKKHRKLYQRYQLRGALRRMTSKDWSNFVLEVSRSSSSYDP